MGSLGATSTQVFARARGEDVSFRDVKIKIPDRNWAQKRGLRIWGFEKSGVEFLPRKKKVDFRDSSRPDQ